MDTIVVGYDGSDQAARALGRAAKLAEGLGARLVVVSVGPPATPTVPSVELGPAGVPLPAVTGGLGGGVSAPVPEEPRPDPAELAKQQLGRARSFLAGRSLRAEYVAEIGDTAERLLDVAERGGADLIVVGTREHGFLERLLARPVDEEVAKRAASDVLLVH